jgi:2-polyprenyl-6-methoxyphenol hydroxylase-like FAD-dependent oxidoreductase
MSARGLRVVVVEKEREFRDRVRGEAMSPWGIPEVRALGVHDLMVSSHGHSLPWVDTYVGPVMIEHRNLPATTRCGAAELAFSHPAMQELLLQAAQDAGASVLRGAALRELQLGPPATAVVELDGRSQSIQAKLVVAADGRLSTTRKLAGFVIKGDRPERLMTGVLLGDMPVSDQGSHSIFDTRNSQLVALFPQGGGRVRAYFSYRNNHRRRLRGEEDVPLLIEESIRAGAPASWYAGARAAGPLATFASDDIWVDCPYRSGVVLVGDAAAANDPMFGQGMALTFRDVRTLTGHLLATDDWDAACRAYAVEHDAYYHVLHIFSHWFEELFYTTGPAADMMRARVLLGLATDRARMPDYFFSGPDPPLTPDVRQRMFGEEATNTQWAASS